MSRRPEGDAPVDDERASRGGAAPHRRPVAPRVSRVHDVGPEEARGPRDGEKEHGGGLGARGGLDDVDAAEAAEAAEAPENARQRRSAPADEPYRVPATRELPEEEGRLPLSAAQAGTEVEGEQPHAGEDSARRFWRLLMSPVVRAPLSVVILARNEKDRVGDALDSVAFADDVVVADTGSTDGTQELARLRGGRIVPIGWEGFVASRNRALAEARHDWVLVLDADERVPEALRAEILDVLERDDPAAAAFRMPRLSYFLGRPVKHGTWYPDYKLRLGRRSRRLRAEGGRVHETLEVDGSVGRLSTPLIHHPYRDLSDAVRKASRYAQLGAEDRYERGARGSVAGLLGRPAFEFFRFLVLKRGFLDGAVGWSVAFLHASSYFLRAAFLLDIQRRPGRNRDETP